MDTGVNAANPRPDNRSGHIIEITEAGDDATATRFHWDVFLMAGDPADGRYHRRRARSRARQGADPTDTYFAGYPESRRRRARCTARTISASIRRADCGSSATPTITVGLTTAASWCPPAGRSAACCSSSRVARRAARSAAANSRPMAARCSCPSSIRAKAAPSTSRAAIGRMATACRRAPRCWPSNARTGPGLADSQLESAK